MINGLPVAKKTVTLESETGQDDQAKTLMNKRDL
jgi:hypothetical protein